MSLISVLLILWGLLTTVLIVLLIYRSTLTMHEDDQLFLDESESHMEQEQKEILQKFNRIRPLIRVLAATSVLLILVIAGLWVYQTLTAVQ
jgi:Tfp pilus assembly protein PilN